MDIIEQAEGIANKAGSAADVAKAVYGFIQHSHNCPEKRLGNPCAECDALDQEIIERGDAWNRA